MAGPENNNPLETFQLEIQDIRHELFWNLGAKKEGEIFGGGTSGLNSLDTLRSFLFLLPPPPRPPAPSSSSSSPPTSSSPSPLFFLRQNPVYYLRGKKMCCVTIQKLFCVLCCSAGTRRSPFREELLKSTQLFLGYIYLFILIPSISIWSVTGTDLTAFLFLNPKVDLEMLQYVNSLRCSCCTLDFDVLH